MLKLECCKDTIARGLNPHRDCQDSQKHAIGIILLPTFAARFAHADQDGEVAQLVRAQDS